MDHGLVTAEERKKKKTKKKKKEREKSKVKRETGQLGQNRPWVSRVKARV
jgi:hypothetical protein